ncbi:MAG TPA: hypothetical protein VN690_02120 [Terriglobales bacterium]|nr:hypothetical protein [Terriglobales bacterium]
MQDGSSTGDLEVLSGREAAILQALLQAYVASGNPVGSLALAQTEAPPRLSSASIRHILAELEKAGFLDQPHVSAGRVPTAKALRWWVQRGGTAQLPADDLLSRQLEHRMREAHDETTLWMRASEYLSGASRNVGMVAVLPWRDAGLKQIRFFRLTDHRVLAILVAGDGQVRERVNRVPESYSQPELDAAARFLTHHFTGSTLSGIRRELQRMLEQERAAYDELLKRVVVLSHSGVLEMQDEGQVYIQGTSHLAGVLQSGELEAMLESLNQKERWLHLLTETDSGEWIEAHAGPGCSAVRVRIGLHDEALPGCSLVAAQCGRGTLAILGPTCMEYPRALAAVALVRELYGRVAEGKNSVSCSL